MLDHALALAARGFHVFPLGSDRTPAIKDFPNRATRDEAQICKWWEGSERGIGVSTTRFGDDQALLALDVDVKNGKRGDASLLQLEMAGNELPDTVIQRTPSGGRHYVYTVPEPMKQSVEQIAPGLDIRSRGGYIVAYDMAGSAPAPAPEWLVQRVGHSPERPARATEVLEGVDRDRAEARALEYLKTAPVSFEGEGGDTTAYKVAAKLKDLGCTMSQTVRLMADHWNERCDPPWDHGDLVLKIEHAHRYGKEPLGSAAPEAIFDAVPAGEDAAEEPAHPVEKLNAEYAFIKEGAFVLQETTDAHGQFVNIRLSPPDMHAWFANKRMQMGERRTAISKVWMESEGRREFDGVVFSPLKDPGPRFYNHWRGFAYEPRAGRHPSVDAFLEHALKNVCNGDEKLCHWLLGYFAHIVQRPWEKPLVALVFRGRKGTGKNALVERVGALLGGHFMVADDERYLLSNFNAHLEANLFFVLDEASWAGDKRAEGKLKGLITGAMHNIEHKNGPVTKVRNLSRVSIVGNERWLVPATFDERRFAVFDVGDGRRQDRAFFEGMRRGMEAGGYGHLLHYLQKFDLRDVDVNAAPVTQGLIEQKHASLEAVHEWWLDCLESDELHGSGFPGAIPERIPTGRCRDAFVAWARERNIKSRLPDHKDFIDQLRQAGVEKKRLRVEGELAYVFVNPGLPHLRAGWEQFIGGPHRWQE